MKIPRSGAMRSDLHIARFTGRFNIFKLSQHCGLKHDTTAKQWRLYQIFIWTRTTVSNGHDLERRHVILFSRFCNSVRRQIPLMPDLGVSSLMLRSFPFLVNGQLVELHHYLVSNRSCY